MSNYYKQHNNIIDNSNNKQYTHDNKRCRKPARSCRRQPESPPTSREECEASQNRLLGKCVCIYYICIEREIHLFIHTHIHTYSFIMFIYIYIYVCVYIYIYTCIYIYIYTHTSLSLSIYIYIYVRMHAYIIHICIYSASEIRRKHLSVPTLPPPLFERQWRPLVLAGLSITIVHVSTITCHTCTCLCISVFIRK